MAILPGYQTTLGIGSLEAVFPDGPVFASDKFWRQSTYGRGQESCASFVSVDAPANTSRPGIACVLTTGNATSGAFLPPLNVLEDYALYGDPRTEVAVDRPSLGFAPSGFVIWSNPSSMRRGTVITFDWNLLTNELDDRPVDFALASLGSQVVELGTSRDANLPVAHSSDHLFARQTGWKRGALVVPADSSVGLAFGVFNEGADSFGDTALLIDNVEIHGSATFVVSSDHFPSRGDIGLRRTSPVTGIPGAEDFVASDGVFEDRVHLSWTAPPGASGYRLFRALSDGRSEPDLIAEFAPTDSYDDTSAIFGVAYEYSLEVQYLAVQSDLVTSDEGFAGDPIPPRLDAFVDGLSAPREPAPGIDFGRVRDGAAAPERVVTVRNSGQLSLTIGGLELPEGFTLVDGLNAEIAPGAEETLTLRMETAVEAVRNGVLEIDSNDPAGARRIPLRGAIARLGPPRVEITGGGISLAGETTPLWAGGSDFDGVLLGSVGEARAFRITNVGEQELTLGDLLVPDGFRVALGLPATLAPGASASLVIEMDSSTLGSKAGDVRFLTNDPISPEVRFGVSGTIVIQGDATADQQITLADYQVWADNYSAPGRISRGDFNRDGIVTLGDFTLWADSLPPAASSLALPVPSTEADAPTHAAADATVLAPRVTASQPVMQAAGPTDRNAPALVAPEPGRDHRAPSIRVTGRRVESRLRTVLSGIASDDVALGRVRYRVRHEDDRYGSWQLADGSDRWRIDVRTARPGTYIVQVSAIDAAGNESRLSTRLHLDDPGHIP
jgi:hypothetical protein